MSKNGLTLPVFGKKSVCFRLGGSFQGPRTLFCRCPTHQNSFCTMFGMIFQLQTKSLHHFLRFRNKITLFPLTTYVMDVITFVSHCLTCEHLVQTYIQSWRPSFTTVVSSWWSATTHVGERRNFVRGLVPMSLYTKLTTPPSSRRKPAHCQDLKLALMARVPLLLNALYCTLEWFNDHRRRAPLTPSTGQNPWRRPWSPYSTSHTTQQRPPPPPTTLPHPSQPRLHTSLQSAPAPLPWRHKPRLENTLASPLSPSGLYR